jgi:hypothetical protein
MKLSSIGAMFLSLILISCDESEVLDISDSCMDEEIEIIQEVFENVNSIVGEDILLTGNTVEVDYESPLSHTIVCIHDLEHVAKYWPSVRSRSNRKTGYSILMRSDLVSGDSFKSSFGHEVIHLLGATNEEHSMDKVDVFYWEQTFTNDGTFTAYDSSLILKYYSRNF